MGKGDIKSKRGKIHNGSYGVRRKRKSDTTVAPVVVAATVKKVVAPKAEAAPKPEKKAAAPKKAPAKKKAE